MGSWPPRASGSQLVDWVPAWLAGTQSAQSTIFLLCRHAAALTLSYQNKVRTGACKCKKAVRVHVKKHASARLDHNDTCGEVS